MATEPDLAERETLPSPDDPADSDDDGAVDTDATPGPPPRWRTFTGFFVAAACVRPMLDLTATPRSSGLALTELFGAGVLLVMLLWLLRHRRLVLARLTGPMPLSLLALAAAYGVATIGGPDWGTGVAATLRIATGLTVFFVVDLLLRLGRLTLREVLTVVLLASAVPVVFPLLGLVGVPVTHEKDGIVALRSVFFLSNNLAHFLVPLLLLALAWTLAAKGRWRLYAGLFAAVLLVEIVLTQTRGAWLGAVVGAIIVCVLINRRVAVVGAALVVACAILVPAVNSRLADLQPDPDQPYSESSFEWRVGQWDRLLPMVSESPVTGGGPGTALRVTGKEAHNDYVKAAVETGLVGLAAYLWVLGAGVVTAWAAWARVRRLRARAPTSPAASPLVGATLAAIAAYAVAVLLASFGENLVDNLTFLWSTMPLLAIAHWARTARPRRLDLEVRP